MTHCNWNIENINDKGRMETLGKITAGVVHDFNNILGTISGFAELILFDMEKVSGFSHAKSAQQYARHIISAGEMAQATIKDLQTLARPDKAHREPIHLNALISQAIGLIGGSMQPNITIIMQLYAKSSRILGFTGSLQNALFNLFLNARDAMPGGGQITVSTILENSETVVVSIKDTGCGIPKELLQKIFDPFFTTKGPNGNGMGLANVLATVESHHGTLVVTSAVNEGTEFTLRFPLAD